MTTEAPPPRPAAELLTWCSSGAGSTDLSACDSEMERRGMLRVRTLVQLRRPLPVPRALRDGVAALDTRPFDPGTDAAGLLEVNNAAFGWHPEQGGWDRSRLDEALAQEWVELPGILVHESAAGHDDAQVGAEADREGAPEGGGPRSPLDGFCWTRVHTAQEPDVADGEDPPGEIWVIATHPRVHGTGLGAAMVLAGLDHLHSRGLQVANLFTEADNRGALAMYARLGFEEFELRGGYLRAEAASKWLR